MPRPEFAVHLLNPEGVDKAIQLANVFSTALDLVEKLSGKDGREMAVVRTNMEIASFFAKKAMATRPENQITR